MNSAVLFAPRTMSSQATQRLTARLAPGLVNGDASANH